LKPEQWGSPLVQEKYQEEKACDKRHPYCIIIIIIIIYCGLSILFTFKVSAGTYVVENDVWSFINLRILL